MLENPESPINLRELLDLTDNLMSDDEFMNLNMELFDESNNSENEFGGESDQDGTLSGSLSEASKTEESKQSSTKEIRSWKNNRSDSKGSAKKKEETNSLALMPQPRISLMMNVPKLSQKKHFNRNFECGFDQLPTEEVNKQKNKSDFDVWKKSRI